MSDTGVPGRKAVSRSTRLGFDLLDLVEVIAHLLTGQRGQGCAFATSPPPHVE
jgi:hypothetical protein